MALDIVKKVLSNDKYAKAVYDYIIERDKNYMDSRCRKRLENRYKWIKASLDGSYSPGRNEQGFSGNQWLPALIFPMVREMHYMTRAMVKKNFRQEPLITFEPQAGTSFENAVNIQEAVKTNFRATNFRSKCFDYVTDSVSRYGVAVTYSQFEARDRQVRKTVPTQLGPMQVIMPQNRKNVWNYPVNPLNYAQNELIPYPEDSDWRRIIESVPVARIIAEYKENPDQYIKAAIKRVISKAESEIIHSEDYHSDDQIARDLARHGVDRRRWWGKLWITGNEDDDTDYYVEIIDDRVVKIKEHDLEENVCPVTVYRMRRRPEYWWGNTPNEDIMPHEKFAHILMNMKFQNAVQALERYIFYPKGQLDIADIQNRHINGGWIPVEMKNNLQMQNMLWNYQGVDNSNTNVDYVFRELKESRQNMAFKPDFLRHGNKGGMANNTATAATILDETGDLLESDCMEVLSYDIIALGRLNAMLLKQFLGDRIMLQVDPKQDPREIWKEELLGDFTENVVSSIHKNNATEMVKLQNAITQIMNYKGSGDPTWANANLYDLAKSWIKRLETGVDEDRVLPPQLPAPVAITQIPGLQNPGEMSGVGAVPAFQPVQPQLQGAPNV